MWDVVTQEHEDAGDGDTDVRTQEGGCEGRGLGGMYRQGDMGHGVWGHGAVGTWAVSPLMAGAGGGAGHQDRVGV